MDGALVSAYRFGFDFNTLWNDLTISWNELTVWKLEIMTMKRNDKKIDKIKLKKALWRILQVYFFKKRIQPLLKVFFVALVD